MESVPSSEIRIKRLRYQSWHRGCKETDIILGNFCDAYIESLEEELLTSFEQLLEEDDADIWAWLTHKNPCPTPAYEPLLDRLRHFREYSPIG